MRDGLCVKQTKNQNRLKQRAHQSKFRSLIELRPIIQVKQDQNMFLSASKKYTECVPCLQMASSHIGNITESVNF